MSRARRARRGREAGPTVRPRRPGSCGRPKNRAIDAARRDAAICSRSADTTGLDGYPGRPDVAAEALGRVAADEIRGMLDRLPDVPRQLIVLVFYGELSHTEIAARLDALLGTTKPGCDAASSPSGELEDRAARVASRIQG